MNRYAKTLLVILASVALGACAGRAKVITIPTPPLADSVDVVAPAPEDPSAVDVLPPIRSLELGDISAFGTPDQPKNLDVDSDCDITDIVARFAADQELAAAQLQVGTRQINYVDVRSGILKPYKDYVKDIALRILDTTSCTTSIVTVTKAYEKRTISVPKKTKKGTTWKNEAHTVAVLKVPSGWDIQVVRRVNDIEWNNWGTEFRINAPSHQVVVGLRYPLVNALPKRGQARVSYVPYVPYSEPLAIPELIAAGPAYLAEQEQRVKDDLRARGVMSEAIPGMLVADAMDAYPKAYPLKYLRPIEHMDEGEFLLDPRWTTDRIYVVIGANGPNFGSHTCSPVGACGAQQFMPGSYRMVLKAFPTAGLIRDVDQGRRDGPNSTRAAALLLDLQLQHLRKVLGPEIINDPYIDELQVAGYNTGPGRSGKVYGLALAKDLLEWTDAKGKRCSKRTGYAECLLNETKGYIAKYRYIRDEWMPKHLATVRE